MQKFYFTTRFAIFVLLIAGCTGSNTTKISNKSVVEVSTSVPRPVMPDVICLTLQDAQDLIQDQGVFYSRSQDATGKNRNQLIDSNWIVVEQNIKPGERFDEADVILQVLKSEEASDSGLCS